MVGKPLWLWGHSPRKCLVEHWGIPERWRRRAFDWLTLERHQRNDGWVMHREQQWHLPGMGSSLGWPDLKFNQTWVWRSTVQNSDWTLKHVWAQPESASSLIIQGWNQAESEQTIKSIVWGFRLMAWEGVLAPRRVVALAPIGMTAFARHLEVIQQWASWSAQPRNLEDKGRERHLAADCGSMPRSSGVQWVTCPVIDAEVAAVIVNQVPTCVTLLDSGGERCTE